MEMINLQGNQIKNMRTIAVIVAILISILMMPVAFAQVGPFSCHVWGKADFKGDVTVIGGGEKRVVSVDTSIGEYRAKFEDKLSGCVGISFTSSGGGTSGTGVFQDPSLRIDLITGLGIPPECPAGTHDENGTCVADPQPVDNTQTIVIGGVAVSIAAAVSFMLGQRRSKTGATDSDLDKIFAEIAKVAKSGTGFRVTFYTVDGVKKYKFAHYHPGISGYHDPGTKHTKTYHKDGVFFIVEGE